MIRPPDATPEVVPSFDDLPLSQELRRAIDELGWASPSPVQRAVFEPARQGRDLVVQARTGTGKTAAFGLPLLDGLVSPETGRVQALILAPTRELALQIARELESLARHRPALSIAAVYGGAPMQRQTDALRQGAQIVAGTPGRVLDHLRRGTLDPSAVRTLVLDESDEMLSMGFLPQIDEVMTHLPATRQTLLFSATLPPEVQRLAQRRLREPEWLILSGDHVGALEVRHFVYPVFGDKVRALLSILEVEDPESAIIFCNTRDDTRRVAAAIQAAGYAADWLNADLAQSDREKVMEATRQGQLRFLVATDVAARGIDVSHLSHVINFDFPESTEAYVHRTGRTGRAGRTGTAISLVEPRNVGNLYLLRLTYRIRPEERQLPTEREQRTRREADLAESLVRAVTARTPHEDDLSLARRVLSHDLAVPVVAALLRQFLGPRAVEEAAEARRRPPPRSRVVGADPAPLPGAPERGPAEQPTRVRAPQPAAPVRHGAGEAPASGGPPRVRRSRARLAEGGNDRDGQSVRAEPGAARGPHEDADDLPGYVVAPRDVPPGETGTSGPNPVTSALGEVFLNVGRRDGLDPQDIRSRLHEDPALRDVECEIDLRQRHSYVRVARPLLERAVKLLNGATLAGKAASAEPARPRPGP